MQSVEFLPLRYRQRQTARRSVARRVAVVAATAAAVGGGTLYQHAQERAARRDLAVAEANDFAAQSGSLRLSELRAELENARAMQLCVFVNRPLPRTQILAAVAVAIPPDVELADLQIVWEVIPQDTAESNASQQAAAFPADQDSRPPALRDLHHMLGERGRSQTVVRFSGAAFDALAIHRFIADLNLSPLLARAELGSQETVLEPGGRPLTRFTASVVVRDAFEPSSPATSLAAASLPRGREP